jgi:hypothetical protein
MSAIYVLKDGVRNGPHSPEELGLLVEGGAYSLQDLYWIEGMDEWAPLGEIVQTEGGAVGEEASEEPVGELLFEAPGIEVRPGKILLPCGEVEPEKVRHAYAHIEKVHRVRPLSVAIVLGVVIAAGLLVEFPRSTLAHWLIWGAVLLALILWWLRILHHGLRAPKSVVAVDLTDGDERLVVLPPAAAMKLAEAIEAVRLPAAS